MTNQDMVNWAPSCLNFQNDVLNQTFNSGSNGNVTDFGVCCRHDTLLSPGNHLQLSTNTHTQTGTFGIL